MSNITDWLFWKNNRARELTSEAAQQYEAYRKSRPITLESFADKRGRITYIAERADEMPGYYALMFEEAAIHLRSILDHIAFHFSRPRDSKEERGIYFPIEDTKDGFRKSVGRKLLGASDKFLELAESFQPFNSNYGSGGYPPLNGDPDPFYLSHIRELTNWSKHRSLVLASVAMHHLHVETNSQNPTANFRVELLEGPLTPGRAVAIIHSTGLFKKDETLAVTP